MPRPKLLRSPAIPYHIVNRVNNREWFPMELSDVWSLISHECYEVSVLFDARIHGFVLMSNHIHMLISTPTYDLGEIMQWFFRSTTQTFNRKTGRSGHLFGGRYRWTALAAPGHYSNTYKYIYRNPIRAGLTETVEDYPYSTLQGLIGNARSDFPLFHTEIGFGDELIPQDATDLLAWLNQPPKSEDDEVVKKALRKRIFRTKINNR